MSHLGRVGEVLLGELDHHTGQAEESDQVRDRHEAVQGVGDVPDQRELQGGADHDDDDEGDLVDLHVLQTEEILKAAGAVEGPAEHSRKREERDADRDQKGADLASEHAAEGCRHVGGSCAAAPVQGQACAQGAAEQRQSGQGADDDGVHEDFEDAVQTLLDGICLRGSRMSHGSGSETGLVGEHAAGHTLLDGGLDHDAGGAADGCVRAESALEDHAKHGAELADVAEDDQDGCHDVDDCHEGHQLLSDGADALDAAQQDQCHDDRDDHADDDAAGGDGLSEDLDGACFHVAAKCVDGGVDGGSDGVDLGHVADTEGGKETEDAEHAAEPAPAFAETVLNVVHRSADPVALVVALAVTDCQDHFGVLGRHAEQSRDPHPEDSAGAACRDGAGDACDVSCADRRRKSGGHGLERCHFTVSGLLLLEDLAEGVLHRVSEAGELDEAHADAQENAGSHKQDQHPGTPRDSVQEINSG